MNSKYAGYVAWIAVHCAIILVCACAAWVLGRFDYQATTFDVAMVFYAWAGFVGINSKMKD